MSIQRLCRLLSLTLLLLLFSFWWASLVAQAEEPPATARVHLVDVNGEEYPIVTAYVDAIGADGQPLTNVTANDFMVTERFTDTYTAAPLAAFPDPHRPLQLVLVLNRGVHIEKEWLTIRQAAIDFLNTLASADEVMLLVYSRQVETVQSWTTNKQEAIAALSKIEFDNTHSVLHDAMLAALKPFADHPPQRANRAIILVTDRAHTSNTSTTSSDDVMQAIQAMEIKIPFYLLCYGHLKKDHKALDAIAHLTGAEGIMAPHAKNVNLALATLSPRLRHGYQLRYISPLPAQNSRHSLTVSLTDGRTPDSNQVDFTASARQIEVALYGVENEQTVAGQIVVSAQASSSVKIKAINYDLDENPLNPSGPITNVNHALELDTDWYHRNKAATEGEPHRLTVRVTDLNGNEGEDTRTFYIAPLPRVETVLLPNQELYIGDTVVITAQLTTYPGFPVTEVQFWRGDQPLPSFHAQLPFTNTYTITMPTSQLATGVYSITARAIDNKGRVSALASASTALSLTPRPTWWAPWVKWVKVHWRPLAWGAALLLLLPLFVWFWSWLIARLKRLQQVTYLLTLTNLGNVPTAYLLQPIDSSGGELRFLLQAQGKSLARYLQPTTVLVGQPTVTTSSTVPSPGTAPIPQPSVPATPNGNGSHPGSRNGVPNGVSNGAPNGEAVRQTLGALSTNTKAIADLLYVVGPYLGPIGRPLVGLAMRARQTESAFVITQRNLQQARYKAQQLTAAVSTSPATGGAQNSNQRAGGQSQPASAAPKSVSASSSPRAQTPSAVVTPPQAQVSTTDFATHLDWLRTPVIEPGYTIKITWIIAPRRLHLLRNRYVIGLRSYPEGQPTGNEAKNEQEFHVGGLRGPRLFMKSGDDSHAVRQQWPNLYRLFTQGAASGKLRAIADTLRKRFFISRPATPVDHK